ncbi:beta-N-acetylglucosaminidase domain-containing protein [Parahaliea mediterranea]|uniref:beta-N-acetylglucosaminidase domain-containing protein n=1 Tax=Parahaliea mediterranea TaxID=651086 RepID=UPI0013007981|nr:beta-N-acetylglucosaminidase domain-containing protein [Parahaliea mediterranea]
MVEGFYGRTWSGATRRDYAELMPAMGLNAYLYCPKADPYLRKQWQQHWPAAQWRALGTLATDFRERGLHFGVGLSPFALYRRYGAPERRQLREKAERIAALGGSLLAILFDDMPGDVPDLAQRQAEIVADIRHWFPDLRLLMCPTYYSLDPVLEKHFGAMPAGYWDELGAAIDVEVDIFWTGSKVCAERVGRQELLEIGARLRRPLTLWDNYPVNDGALRSKHLYTAPLAGREAGLGDALRGHFCNPMNQAWLSLPALRGLAELYGTATLPKDWEAQALGSDCWQHLQRDGRRFQEVGLDGLDAAARSRLAAEYAALPGAAAGEVAGWLRGEYTFDPACLTD